MKQGFWRWTLLVLMQCLSVILSVFPQNLKMAAAAPCITYTASLSDMEQVQSGEGEFSSRASQGEDYFLQQKYWVLLSRICFLG